MNLLSTIPDNISEVLVKIVQFTRLRRGVLCRNVREMGDPGYVPMDLPVAEFACLLHVAITEHLQQHRLLFCDTANIKFGSGGSMRVRPIVDEYARAVLDANPDEYVELQIKRLLENSLNHDVAEELMQQNYGTIWDSTKADLDEVMTGGELIEDLPSRPNATD
jgi:hypothetical protein